MEWVPLELRSRDAAWCSGCAGMGRGCADGLDRRPAGCQTIHRNCLPDSHRHWRQTSCLTAIHPMNPRIRRASDPASPSPGPDWPTPGARLPPAQSPTGPRSALGRPHPVPVCPLYGAGRGLRGLRAGRTSEPHPGSEVRPALNVRPPTLEPARAWPRQERRAGAIRSLHPVVRAGGDRRRPLVPAILSSGAGPRSDARSP